jgi:hypothetical protein
MIKLKSTVKPLEGILSIRKDYPDGRKIKVFEEENMIMLLSKQYILSCVYADSGTFDPVKTLRVGTGGTIDPEGLYPKPVNQNLSALYTNLLSTPVSFTKDDNVPSVTFIADLDQGTGNNQLITEAGLFTQAGLMFNIKTFPGIPKTSEFALHLEWTIKIS